MSLRLNVIVCSTRPGRIGPSIARWFYELALSGDRFDVRLIDLAHFSLPVYDEAVHPANKRYAHAHTKAWSASVGSADAFVFVTPEYNHSLPPSLVNALTYVFEEWNYKPAGFVSYGGISGGLRCVEASRHLIAALRMVPIPESVPIVDPRQHLDNEAVFAGNERHTTRAAIMLAELSKWALASRSIRSL